MVYKSILVLTGGTGTVKLLSGLYELIPEQLTIITNTADDFSFYGQYVSPDTDAVLYALSNLLDVQKHWGISGDTFTVKDILAELDNTNSDAVASWFNLGDKDLAYCLYRTYLMQSGKTLSEAVDIIAKKLKIKSTIFPMADSLVGTYFTTEQGEYHLEEYFIRLRTQPEIKAIEIRGAEDARVSSDLLEAVSKADLIIIGPSNPVSSIGPILKIPSIYKSIKSNPCPKLVISPIIGDSPVSGPAHKYMEVLGCEVSPVGVYSCYEELGTHFMFHNTDEERYSDQFTKLIQEKGQSVFFEDIIISTKEKQIELAKKILKMSY